MSATHGATHGHDFGGTPEADVVKSRAERMLEANKRWRDRTAALTEAVDEGNRVTLNFLRGYHERKSA